MFSEKEKIYIFGILGILVVAVSMFFGRLTGIEYFHIGFLVGSIMFFETVISIVKCQTLFSEWYKNPGRMVFVLVLGAITGVVIFDLPGIYIFEFWGYPVFSNLFHYLLLAPGGWALFFLLFYESFQVLHLTLDKNYPELDFQKEPFLSRRFFSTLGLSGILIFIFAVVLTRFNIKTNNFSKFSGNGYMVYS